MSPSVLVPLAYRIRSFGFLHREEDDHHLVYDPHSGETHLLNFLSYALLKILCSPERYTEVFMKKDTIKQELDKIFGDSLGKIDGAVLDNSLRDLDEAGLISPFDLSRFDQGQK